MSEKTFEQAYKELLQQLHTGANTRQTVVDAWNAQAGIVAGEQVETVNLEAMQEGTATESVAPEAVEETVQKSLTEKASVTGLLKALVDPAAPAPELPIETLSKAIEYLTRSTLAVPMHLQKGADHFRGEGDAGKDDPWMQEEIAAQRQKAKKCKRCAKPALNSYAVCKEHLDEAHSEAETATRVQ